MKQSRTDDALPGAAIETLSQSYQISLPASSAPLLRGHLELGGVSVSGESITVNNRYIEWNGRPFVPVVGEFHYARCSAAYWDEAIRKLKSGGINVVATYVFWNMHEREAGCFDWSGDLDLRRFVELCAENKMKAIVRVGPFCHGEIRNGGLPDWLYGMPFEVRSNDPAYLHYVERFFARIGEQLDRLLFKDDGPVIGIQLENEYQHSAAPWEFGYPGSTLKFTVADRDADVTFIQITANDKVNRFADEGRAHMVTLKRLARDAGLDAPLFTVTGWGNAAIVEKGSVPVTAGYPYPSWSAPSPSAFFLYADLRRVPDYAPVGYDPALYPSISAEMGGGMIPSFKRRPVVPPESLPPLITRTVGSGSNGVGYYVMHGGSNPVIDGHFFNEQAGGLARINYDYQAPIGEFGQLRPHFYALRPLHYFLETFGDRLAPMETCLPASAGAQRPEQVDRLRFAVRADGARGFVFMHQFQNHVAAVPDLTDVSLTVRHVGGESRFPREGGFTLKNGRSAIFPFNLDVGPLVLESATVQPLTVLKRDDGRHHVFVGIEGIVPEFVWAGLPAVVGDEVDVVREDGRTVVRPRKSTPFRFECDGEKIVVLPDAFAERALRLEDALYISDFDLFYGKTGLEVRSIGATEGKLLVYPADVAVRCSDARVLNWVKAGDGFGEYSLTFVPTKPGWRFERRGSRRLVLHVEWPSAPEATDLWLQIPFNGDRVEAYLSGKLVGDHFYNGIPWELGLRKFQKEVEADGLVLLYHPSHRTYPYLQDLAPEKQPRFADGEDEFLEIGEPILQVEYRAILWAS